MSPLFYIYVYPNSLLPLIFSLCKTLDGPSLPPVHLLLSVSAPDIDTCLFLLGGESDWSGPPRGALAGLRFTCGLTSLWTGCQVDWGWTHEGFLGSCGPGRHKDAKQAISHEGGKDSSLNNH